VRGVGYRCLAEYLASLSPGSYNNEPSDYTGDPADRIYDSGVGSRCARTP
jgi:hypothetical protein